MINFIYLMIGKMKLWNKILFVFIVTCMSADILSADDKEKWVYTDAAEFPLLGKAVMDDGPRYQRLPQKLEGVSRDAVWYLGRNSAGMCVRFSSDSPSIRIKWTSLFKNSMNHMTDTGTRGVDLYILTDDGWRFAGAGRPVEKTTDALVISGMESKEREYMLYLSLYDGVEELYIGVEKGYSLEQPKVGSPSREKPVVMYGTSILQGGCASRPGMAHTNMMSRKIDREIINLGFSGNALLDFEIAELMASVEDPGLFVLDYVPNASAEQIREKGEQFFNIIREAHPDVPVIFVEDPHFPYMIFDHNIRKEVLKKNEAQKALYESLRKKGVRKISYVSADGMIGDDGEATVDGIHFTDLGASRYVEHLYPAIRKALK